MSVACTHAPGSVVPPSTATPASATLPVTGLLRVPGEIRGPEGGAPGWFRLAHGVSEGGLLFPRALPDELRGPVEIAFHLPEDPSPIACRGQVIEVDGDERADERPL